eukprot:evm.model.scf_242.4 EVM.evm.TU.scf_242.4   scf_242:73500-80879(+)
MPRAKGDTDTSEQGRPARAAPEQERTDTLAGASQSGLDRLLGRGDTRAGQREAKRRAGLLKKAAKAAGLFVPEEVPTIDGTCGAPAKRAESDDGRRDTKGDEDAVRDGMEEDNIYGGQGAMIVQSSGEEDDEEWDDVSWEGADDIGEGRSPQEGDDVSVAWGKDVKQGKKRSGITKEERQFRQSVHKAHILCLLCRGMLLDKIADNELLQASILSMVPKQHALLPNPDQQNEPRSALEGLVLWFKSHFRVVQPTDGLAPNWGYNGSSDSRCLSEAPVSALREAVEKGKGTAEQLCLLFTALLRALGLVVRLVRILDAFPLHPRMVSANKKGSMPDSKIQKKMGGRRQQRPSSKRKREAEQGGEGTEGVLSSCADDNKKVKNRGDEEFERELAIAMAATAFKSREDVDGDPKEKHGGQSSHGQARPPTGDVHAGKRQRSGSGWSRSLSTHFGNGWCEVFWGSPGGGKWVHVDGVMGWIDRPDVVHDCNLPSLPLAYVVAFLGGGAKDVTKRYSPDFTKAERHRSKDWWARTMAPLRSREVAALGTCAQPGRPQGLQKSGACDERQGVKNS